MLNSESGFSVPFFQLTFYTSTDCATGTDTGAPDQITVSVLSWHLYSQGGSLPAGTHNAMISAVGSSLGGSVDVNFDRLFVGPVGTTPVTLVRFDAE